MLHKIVMNVVSFTVEHDAMPFLLVHLRLVWIVYGASAGNLSIKEDEGRFPLRIDSQKRKWLQRFP